jgi:hypothetical protein
MGSCNMTFHLVDHDITVEPQGSSYNHVNLLTFMKLSAARKSIYEACPESKDTKVLNMYNIFNLQKRQCE